MNIINTFCTRITKTRIALDSVQAIIGTKWLWIAIFALSFLICETVAGFRYVYTFLFYENKQAQIEKAIGHGLGEPLVVINFLTEYAIPAVGWSICLTAVIFLVISFSRENEESLLTNITRCVPINS